MAERKRNKEIHFYVTEEERKLIRRKMIESKTKNMGAYLRKMAIDGIPSFCALSIKASIDACPSSSEYWVCTCRCINGSIWVLNLFYFGL